MRILVSKSFLCSPPRPAVYARAGLGSLGYVKNRCANLSSLSTSLLMEKDVTFARAIQCDYPSIEKADVYIGRLSNQEIHVYDFKRMGAQEIHFANASKNESLGKPYYGTLKGSDKGEHTYSSIRIYTFIAELTVKHLSVGRKVRIQSGDAMTHTRHLKFITKFLEHHYPRQYKLLDEGMMPSLMGGFRDSFLIVRNF